MITFIGLKKTRLFPSLKHIVSFVALYLLSIWGFAQQNNLKFHNITLKDGLSQSSINTIIQDEQGFMWFGTQDGLNRYDGYEFKIFQHRFSDSTGLSDNFIRFLYQDNKNYLWIGTDNGLNLYNPSSENFRHFLTDNPKGPNISFWDMCELDDTRFIVAQNNLYKVGQGFELIKIPNSLLGNIKKLFGRKIITQGKRLWIATEGNGVIMYQPANRHFKRFSIANSNLPSDIVWTVKEINNDIWIGHNKGLSVYRTLTGEIENLPVAEGYPVKAIFKDAQNKIWIGTDGDGIYQLTENGNIIHIQSDPTNIYSLVDDVILSFYQDQFGCIWIGTEHGISKFDMFKQYFKHYLRKENTPNTLSSNTIWSIFYDDRSKIIYTGTDKGLDVIYSSGRVDFFQPSFPDFENGKNTSIYSIKKISSGRVLVGSDGGIFEWGNNRLAHIYYPNTQLNNDRIYKIYEDRNGKIWFCGRQALYCVQNDSVVVFDETVLPSTPVRDIVQQSPNIYWVATNSGGLCRLDIKTKTVTVISNAKKSTPRISNNAVLSLLLDNDILWIGTFGGGLNKLDLKTNRIKHFTVENGLPNNVVYGILKDKNNHLWMSTNKGLCKFNTETDETVNYYESDGLQSNEFNTGAYFKSPDGLMFFGGINGFNMFNPEEIQNNPYPPKLVFTGFNVNNLKSEETKQKIYRAFVHHQSIDLAYNQNFITISFAALHYSAPEKNKYQYKLSPLNEEWISLGNSHQVLFSNLEPGEYTLEVRASNADGIWTPEPISMNFVITPPFWKTWWFRIAVIGALILIVFLYYRSRIQMIKRQKEILEMQVLERTARIRKQKERIEKQKAELEQKQKELELEKEKSEKLLLNILPEKTVTELKIKGKSKPRHYNLVSVMFADFKNFTKISENLRPEELVRRLDSYFIKFDEIIEEHHVEKIKTMGDAYMAAAGVPIRNKTNPIDITLAALKIQAYMRESNAKLDESDRWYLRIGIHTGEVTAGVIGLKRFAYDIWGDTVNVASRVETSGEPGKVNISGQTYEQIKEFFDCEYRGKIPAKNKGEIDMYFVNRIKPELSENEEGTVPNKQFWNYVNLHIFSQINYRKAEKYVLDLLRRELPENLYYHSLNHTIDVTEAVERLALMEKIDGEDIFLLKTAALYHDAGFVKQYDHNEPIGAAMAAEVLSKFGYTDEQIVTIQELILATAIPQQPKNKLQQIICDADLDYLGRDDFHTIADLLKKELMERGKITSDRQWDEIQVSFLTAHRYHTRSAIKLRQEKKLKHLEEIKERLKKYK